MRTIQSIDVFPIRLPITQTFRFSSGSAGAAGETAPFVLVRLTDSAGEIGWGEGRPMPQWSYETVESITTAIRRYLAPAILGQEIMDRGGLHRRMHSVVGRGPSTGFPIAKAAVDMALHDLAARSAGLPLRGYLGGSSANNTIALSYTVTAHDVETARKEVEGALEQGFRHFNFKAAVAPETDLALAKAIRQTAGQDAFVWADANQGFQPHEALRVARGFADVGVNVLEQPFPADQLQLMRRLRNQCPIPLAVDEASVSPADFFHYAAEGLVDYLIVKVTTAQAAGLPFLVSGLTDSLLTKLAACQLAATFGHAGPAALNGSQFIDESALYPNKSQYELNGMVQLGEQSGIGVQPDQQRIEQLLIKDEVL
jgi:muconate cycloisomerase